MMNSSLSASSSLYSSNSPTTKFAVDASSLLKLTLSAYHERGADLAQIISALVDVWRIVSHGDGATIAAASKNVSSCAPAASTPPLVSARVYYCCALCNSNSFLCKSLREQCERPGRQNPNFCYSCFQFAKKVLTPDESRLPLTTKVQILARHWRDCRRAAPARSDEGAAVVTSKTVDSPPRREGAETTRNGKETFPRGGASGSTKSSLGADVSARKAQSARDKAAHVEKKATAALTTGAAVQTVAKQRAAQSARDKARHEAAKVSALAKGAANEASLNEVLTLGPDRAEQAKPADPPPLTDQRHNPLTRALPEGGRLIVTVTLQYHQLSWKRWKPRRYQRRAR